VRTGISSVAHQTIELFPEGKKIEVDVNDREQGTNGVSDDRHPRLSGYVVSGYSVTENSRFQATLKGNTMFIENRKHLGPWLLSPDIVGKRNAGIIAQRGDIVAIQGRGKVTTEPRGIYGGTRSPTTWAHWLINFLPAVHLTKKLGPEFDNFPMLVPTSIPDDTHWQESLRLVLGGRTSLSLHPDSYTRFDRLLWLEPAAYDTPFSIDHARQTGVSLHYEAMQEFRKEFLNYSNVNSSSQFLPTKVFLARKEGTKRPYNQEECISQAADFGFEAVYIEDLTLSDKIRLFFDAEVVVGPLGSGFSNVLFSSPRTSLLSWWTYPLGITDNFEFNLAKVSGARYNAAPLSWILPGISGDSYSLDLEKFSSGLAALLI